MMPSLQTNNNFIAQSRAIIQDNKNSKLYNSPKNDLFPKDEYDKDDFLDEDDDDSFDYTKYDPAVAAQIRKAKKLVSDAKKTIKKNEEAAAKAAAAADGETDDTTTEKEASKPSPLPFFAAKTPDSKKIKSKTESGGIIADGEEMASLSKSEAWESRSLSQMFESESGRDYDGNVVEGADLNANKVAERDIAMGIYNLRKKLQTEDFFKVFDKRNRRIGDLDWYMCV